MFYGADKIKNLPNKTILEDVLTRAYAPDDESMSPFVGCSASIDEFLSRYANNRTYAVAEIIREAADFDPRKARPTDEAARLRDQPSADYDEYFMNLEDIDQSYIEKYVENVLYGFIRNVHGKRDIDKELGDITKFYDEEEDEWSLPSDILPEEVEYTSEEKLEFKQKLPYLLRLLHEGSKKMKGSLLSFAIAAEKSQEMCGDVTPISLCQYGAFRVDEDGDYICEFIPDDNHQDPFITLKEWARGDYADDMYYKAYRELVKVCTALGVKLSEENAREFDSAYIDKMICTYIASNQEYLETFGNVDPRIMAVIGQDSLFDVKAKISGPEETYEFKMTVADKLEQLVCNYEYMATKGDSTWDMNIDKVKRFIKLWEGVSDKEVNTIIKHSTPYKGILLREDGEPYMITTTEKRQYAAREVGILTVSGMILGCRELSGVTIEYVDAMDWISAVEGGYSIDWDYCVL